MAKQGEIDYLKNIGEDGVLHAVNKPFSDPACGKHFVRLGVMMSFFPPSPAKLLDLGCGTGWTSGLFARMGYEVTGVDIAPDMIFEAEKKRDREGVEGLTFVVSEYEEMNFKEEFDCAVFYDCLHHSEDEVSAVKAVYDALKPGGVCITFEPGVGHEESEDTKQVVEKFNVTERDMPPTKILAAGKKAGFSGMEMFPSTDVLNSFYYGDFDVVNPTLLERIFPFLHKLKSWSLSRFKLIRASRETIGIAVMRK